MDHRMLEHTGDYEAALLRFLDGLPGGQGETAVVCHLFEKEYRDAIPEADRHIRPSVNQPAWYNNLCWARQNLKLRGFVDMPRIGVWRITEAGRRWLEENPHATRLPKAKETAPPKVSTRRTREPLTKPVVIVHNAPGITLDMLEQTRKGMPADQFRRIWGVLYDQLLAEERAKAITEIAPGTLGIRARHWLDGVHAVLQGKAGAPASEVVCDWMQFCYMLDLSREAAALLPFVHEADVGPTSYARARRVAEVCRSKC